MTTPATINHLLDLFFPRLCVVCGRRLTGSEQHLCLHCLQHLPRTSFHREESHAMEQLFRGKIDIDNAFALFYSSPHSPYRNLLHYIKYHDGKECARYLGQLYARELCADNRLDGIDTLIPVPLHRARLRERGYNQSEWIARGIADVSGIAIDTHSLGAPETQPVADPPFTLRPLAQHPRHLRPLAPAQLHRPAHSPCRRHRHDRCHSAGLRTSFAGGTTRESFAAHPLICPIKIGTRNSSFYFFYLILYIIFVCHKTLAL